MKAISQLFILAILVLISFHNGYSQCMPGDPDADNDGICDQMDICPNSPLNQDLDNDGICDSAICDLAEYNTFDGDFTIWSTKSITYSRVLYTSNAVSGNYALMLYSNDNLSYFNSHVQDVSGYNEIVLTLNFNVINYLNGETFEVALSTDDGDNYNLIETFEYGVDFDDNLTQTVKIYIPGPFSTETRFLVRANGTGYLYFDDIKLEYCASCNGLGDPNENGHCDCYLNIDTDNDGICDGEDICPNLDNALLGTSCDDGNPCTNNDIWIEACLCQGTKLVDSDNDGICDQQDACPNISDQIDIDNDGIPYCLDNCIDVNENGICEPGDTASIDKPLQLYFTKSRGFYSGNATLELIASDPNATILYSTNWGSEWKYSDFSAIANIYANAITISGHTQVRALAFTANDTTELQSHTYLDKSQYSAAELAVYETFPIMELSHVSFENRYSDELTIMEVFWPHKQKDGISAPAGIRNRKYEHAAPSIFRLYFRSEYGMGRLNYELFPDITIGAQSAANYDKINLHGGSQDGFGDYWYGAGTMMRDRFFQNLQLEANGNGPRGQYYLMFDKGTFMGVKNAEEMPHQAYMEEYFGQDESEYGLWTYYSYELLAGNTYENIQTKTDFYNAIDVPNFIDYSLVQWLAGNQDWGSNNVDIGGQVNGPYYHWAWDMHATDFDGNGIYGTYINYIPVPDSDADFRMDFADRIYLHFYNDGVFTKENLTASWLKLKAKLDPIMPIMETETIPLYSVIAKYDIWERAVMDHYTSIYKATDILLQWLKDNGYYPDIDPVLFNLNNGQNPSGSILDLTNPNSTGDIYYTLNGEDPRNSGGAINPAAQNYNGPVSLIDGTVQVTARVKNGTVWSAAEQMVFQVGNNGGLIINEIHFNPLDGNSNGSEYEFVELKNTGSTAVNLEYFRLEGGVRFKFDYRRSPIIQPGDFVVIANNDSAFQAQYGFAPDGEFVDKLSNSSELIQLVDTRFNEVNSFVYDDGMAPCSDAGYSLSFNPNGTDNSDINDWFASAQINGTPGAENIVYANVISNVIINEIHYNPLDSIYFNNATAMNDTINGSNFEFVEIKNIGNGTVSLNGLYINEGIEMIAPSGLSLAANEIAVFAKDAFWFEEKYGFQADGVYEGKLSNAGESIQMITCNGSLVDSINYDDVAPWDPIPDAGAYSLAFIPNQTNNDDPANWATQFVNFTPGEENEFCIPMVNDPFIINADCNGNATGSIVLITDGGTTPLNYTWANGMIGPNITNIAAGNYGLTVTDKYGCSITENFTVNEPSIIQISESHIDESIANANDGSVNISVTGGTPPYIYNWSNGFATEDIANLSPGNYTLNLTDANGCNESLSITIEAGEIPCTIPGNIIASNLQNTSATLSWDAIANASNYEVEYRVIGATVWNSFNSAYAFAILNNLNTCTEYEVRIKASCASGISGYSSIYIFETTGCVLPCTTINGLFSQNVTNSSAFLVWDIVPNATYTLYYRAIGNNSWLSYPSQFPIAILFTLPACVDFEWYVEVNCTNGQISQSSPIANFSTLGANCKLLNNHIDENLNSITSFNIYPNPASQYLNVSFFEDVQPKSRIVIYDALGKIYFSNEVENSIKHHQINIEDFADGIYTLAIINTEKINTKKFIVDRR